MAKEKIKVITTKLGLDDHYRGIISVTEAFRDAGMEVVYLGTAQKVEAVIATAVQEDADVIGVSFLCGGHLAQMSKLIDQLREKGLERILVIVGGLIPELDIPELLKMGVAKIFLPGTPLQETIDFVTENVAQ